MSQHQADSLRDDYMAAYAENAHLAAGEFFAELRDAIRHYPVDEGFYVLEHYHEGLEPAVQDVLDRVRHLQGVAARAVHELEQALARRTWLTSRAPLRCGNCGDAIDLTYDDWRVCGGWAEHETCHEVDPDAEAQARAMTVDDDEYDAWCRYWTEAGPRDGDSVALTLPNGESVAGIWQQGPGQAPTVLSDRDGVLHDPTGLEVEVTEPGSVTYTASSEPHPNREETTPHR